MAHRATESFRKNVSGILYVIISPCGIKSVELTELSGFPGHDLGRKAHLKPREHIVYHHEANSVHLPDAIPRLPWVLVDGLVFLTTEVVLEVHTC